MDRSSSRTSPLEASSPPRSSRSAVVAVFEDESAAQRAVDALQTGGPERHEVAVLAPGRQSPAAETSQQAGAVTDMLSAAASDGGNVADVLVTMGVPRGEARFYAEQLAEGNYLIVVPNAEGHDDATRDVLLAQGGFDVQSRGGDLARAEGAGRATGTGPPPIDVTHRWEDVVSRYEMLWQQHYGTTDATWEQMSPVYEFAWQLANDARFRGKPWDQVEPAVREAWHADRRTAGAWSDIEGPVRDVFEDVADEATTGAEGGADRRIPRQGTDQVLPARDITPPE